MAKNIVSDKMYFQMYALYKGNNGLHTISEIARRYGVSRSTVAYWVKGEDYRNKRKEKVYLCELERKERARGLWREGVWRKQAMYRERLKTEERQSL